jgi:hypothetical protein
MGWGWSYPLFSHPMFLPFTSEVKSRQRTFGVTHKLKLNSQIRKMSLHSECQAVLFIPKCNHPQGFNRIYPGFSFLGDWRRIQRACIETSGFVICGFPYPELQYWVSRIAWHVRKRHSVVEQLLSTCDMLSSIWILTEKYVQIYYLELNMFYE